MLWTTAVTTRNLGFAPFTPSLYTCLLFAALRLNNQRPNSILVIILKVALGLVGFDLLIMKHINIYLCWLWLAPSQASLQLWPIQLDHGLTFCTASWIAVVGWRVLPSSVLTKHDSIHIAGRGVKRQRRRSCLLFRTTEPLASGRPLHPHSTGRG